MSFWGELRRRNVIKVAVAYGVVGWLLAQVAALAFPILLVPEWVLRAFVALLVLGFPVAVLLAWAYELTPDGIRGEHPAEARAVTRKGRRALTYALVSVLVIATAAFVIVRERAGMAEASVQAIMARPSVMVLPFTDTSRDGGQVFLSVGLTDEIITGLQEIQSFPVIPRNVSFEYRGSELSAQEFATNF